MAATDVEIPLEDGPWEEMLDSLSPTARRPGRYLLGQNTYPLDPEVADGMVGRPGVRQMGAQLGSAGSRQSQGTFQYTTAAGTKLTIQITGGRFYVLNWATETWSEELTDLLGSFGVTLSSTAKIAFLQFQEKVLISDGINKPWLWNGTGGGGVTVLTNAEAFYGQPRAHYARIVAISAADPDTIIWSETDAPNTGYRSGGYNNAWTLTQTDPDRLYSILAGDGVLYALRARGGTALLGPPGPDWQTTATKDSLSDTFGTISPFVTTFQDVNVLALDADAHPQLYRPGGAGFIPIWREFRETLKRIPKQQVLMEKATSVYYSPAGLLLISLCQSGVLEPNLLLVYDVKGDRPVPVAIWKGWEMTTLAMAENQNGQAYLLHGDSTGRVYLHANPEDDAPWDDILAAGTVPIEHIHECQPLGHSTKREKVFDRIDITTRGRTQQTLEISYRTPRGQGAPQTIVIGQTFLGYDSGIYDDPSTVYDPGTDTTEETHGDVGIEGEGRWIKPKIRHATLGEQFSLTALTVAAYVSDDDPEVP
jgi:hypothetical protein